MGESCFVCQDACTTRACRICNVSYVHRQCFQELLQHGFGRCPGCSTEYCINSAPNLQDAWVGQNQNGDRTVTGRTMTRIERFIKQVGTRAHAKVSEQRDLARRKRAFVQWAGRVTPALASIFENHQGSTDSVADFNVCMQAMLMSVVSSDRHLEFLRNYLRAQMRIKTGGDDDHVTERMIERDVSYMHMICDDCSRWDAFAPCFENNVKRGMKNTSPPAPPPEPPPEPPPAPPPAPPRGDLRDCTGVIS